MPVRTQTSSMSPLLSKRPFVSCATLANSVHISSLALRIPVSRRLVPILPSPAKSQCTYFMRVLELPLPSSPDHYAARLRGARTKNTFYRFSLLAAWQAGRISQRCRTLGRSCEPCLRNCQLREHPVISSPQNWDCFLLLCSRY